MKTISIILYHIQAWIRFKRVYRIETTYGYTLVTKGNWKKIRVYEGSTKKVISCW